MLAGSGRCKRFQPDGLKAVCSAASLLSWSMSLAFLLLSLKLLCKTYGLEPVLQLQDPSPAWKFVTSLSYHSSWGGRTPATLPKQLVFAVGPSPGPHLWPAAERLLDKESCRVSEEVGHQLQLTGWQELTEAI